MEIIHHRDLHIAYFQDLLLFDDQWSGFLYSMLTQSFLSRFLSFDLRRDHIPPALSPALNILPEAPLFAGISFSAFSALKRHPIKPGVSVQTWTETPINLRNK